MRVDSNNLKLSTARARPRTFSLLSRRPMFLTIAHSSYLTLATGRKRSMFSPRVSKVFKKERTSIRGVPQFTHPHSQHVEFNFSPVINLSYPVTAQSLREYFETQNKTMKKFANHFTLLTAPSKSESAVVTTRLDQRIKSNAVRHIQNQGRLDSGSNRSFNNASILFLQRQDKPGPQFLVDRRPLRQTETRHRNFVDGTSAPPSQTQNLNHQFTTFNPLFKTFALHLNRNLTLRRAKGVSHLIEPFRIQSLRTILNNRSHSIDLAAPNKSLQFPVRSLPSIAVQLVLPKISGAKNAEERLAQFMSRPEMTHIKTQQNSSENIIEVLREIQKQRSQPPQKPTTQIPSIEQLTSQVRTQLERELRIERERRGI